ncbi:NmrA/HSCARG family protein [Umezawaea sp.]|uniref:NmrA/HSCARG family protein n=1 Tax=Umezawaea sp. TaxID=1955258 RepID=UPI002ED5B7C1
MSEALVIGGTGAMGGSVVLRLLEATSDDVLVLTRDPDSPRAERLADLGGGRVRLLRGDVGDPATLHEGLELVDAVFCNTDFFSTGSVVGEYEQGLAILDAARAANVDRFVWSSLDHAAVLTGGRLPVPHYDGKGAVAAHIGLRRSDEVMRRETDGWYSRHVSVLTTAPYFENFPSRLAPRPGRLPDGREGLLFEIPLGSGRYPLIGLDDIAWFAVHVLDRWETWGGRDLAVAADSLTGEQIAAAFERVTGTPAAYVPVPLDAVRAGDPDFGHDFAAMFEFFATRDLVGLDRDLPALRDLHPGLLSFEDWLRTSGWDGTRRDG